MCQSSEVKQCAVCRRYSASHRLMKSFLASLMIGHYEVASVGLWLCETCRKENTKKGFEKPEISIKLR